MHVQLIVAFSRIDAAAVTDAVKAAQIRRGFGKREYVITCDGGIHDRHIDDFDFRAPAFKPLARFVEDFSDVRVEPLVFEELTDERDFQRRKRRACAGFEI